MYSDENKLFHYLEICTATFNSEILNKSMASARYLKVECFYKTF